MSLMKFDLRKAWDWGGLSIRQLAVRTWKAIDRHDTLNQAAVVAFYAMLSLVPLIGFVLALAVGVRGGVANEVLDLSQRFLPPQADSLVHDQVRKIQSGTPVSLLSISAVLLLWSASSLFTSVMETLNVAYGVRDDRPYWKKHLMALLMTLVEVVLIIAASALAIAWPYVIDHLHLGGLATVLTFVAQWIVVVVMLLGAFELAYYFGPHVAQRWQWVTPGAVLGLVILVLASFGFRLYIVYGSHYSETYGALAGVILMMLWLYIAALALLVGAELNCVIAQADPKADQPVPKAGLQEEPSAAEQRRSENVTART
jgi:membrane protein